MNCYIPNVMEIPGKFPCLFTATLLAASCAALAQQQPSGDPNNPQRSAPSTSSTGQNQSAPSILDMGFGTDQGNVGIFPTAMDKQFAQRTAIRSMMEIQLAEAALDKSETESAKQLAHRILDDYSKWTPIIEKISARARITLPTGLDSKHKAEVEKVTALSGSEFDRAFFHEMVRLQNRALTVTHYEADNAGLAAFRGWSGNAIPAMQDHLHLAKQGLDGAQLASKR